MEYDEIRMQSICDLTNDYVQTLGRQHISALGQPIPETTSLAHSFSLATQEPSIESQVLPDI